MKPRSEDALLQLRSLDEDDAAELLGVSSSFLEKKRREGGGPRFVRISRKCVRYRVKDLEAWQDSRLRDNNIQLAAE